MIIYIEPVSVVHTGAKVEIRIPNFELGATTCIVVAYIHNNEGEVIKAESITIPPEVYSQWAEDDDFICNYVLEQMNCIRAPPPEITEVPVDNSWVPDIIVGEE